MMMATALLAARRNPHRQWIARDKTFGVQYSGVGNEAWGCGGNFCPEDYAVER